MLAAVVALHEGNLGAVGTPLHVLRPAAENAAGLENVFDGQLFLTWRARMMGLACAIRREEDKAIKTNAAKRAFTAAPE